MKHQKYFYFGIIAVLAVVVIFLIVGCSQQKQPSVQARAEKLIFKLNNDYSQNYIGVINYYNDTDTYRSFFTYELFDYCYMISKSNDVYDDTTGEKVHDGMDSEEEICFNMNSDDLSKRGIKKLSNGYYVAMFVNPEASVKNIAIFDKSIITKAISESDRLSIVPATFPNGIKPGMGDSMEMSHDEFYNYVIDNSPLIEAYSCDDKEEDLNVVARDLFNGEIPITCKQII